MDLSTDQHLFAFRTPRGDWLEGAEGVVLQEAINGAEAKRLLLARTAKLWPWMAEDHQTLRPVQFRTKVYRAG